MGNNIDLGWFQNGLQYWRDNPFLNIDFSNLLVQDDNPTDETKDENMHRERVSLIQYNVGNAKDKRVRQDVINLAKLNPLVITLNEIHDRQAQVHDVPGYRTLVNGSQQASDHIGLLVRDDVRYVEPNLDQISSEADVERIVAGARKDGKVAPKYIWSVRLPEYDIRVGVTHLTPSTSKPGAVKARAVYRKQVAGCAGWLARRPEHRYLLGDFNGDPHYHLLHPLLRMSRPHSAATHGMRHIDIAWMPKPVSPVFTAALNGYSSDHRPLRVTWNARILRKSDKQDG